MEGTNDMTNKLPFVTKEMIEEITKTYPTPFHIYDEKGIRENAKAMKEARLPSRRGTIPRTAISLSGCAGDISG